MIIAFVSRLIKPKQIALHTLWYLYVDFLITKPFLTGSHNALWAKFTVLILHLSFFIIMRVDFRFSRLGNSIALEKLDNIFFETAPAQAATIQNRPPKLAESMLGLFLSPNCKEEILGDLQEDYISTYNEMGMLYAYIYYWKSVTDCIVHLFFVTPRKIE